MKKLLSLVSAIALVVNLVPTMVETIFSNNQQNIQSNTWKMPNFIEEGGVVINLNDVYRIKHNSENTMVYFTDGSRESTFGKGMWDVAVNRLKDNAQYFRNNDEILNINYIVRASQNGNNFVLNKAVTDAATVSRGGNGYDEFIKHINKH